jgi:hypothetical protein
MIWTRPDRWHMASTCGRYTVSRANVGEAAHYTGWRVGRKDQPARILATGSGPADDEDARKLAIETCKLACEADEIRTRGTTP